MEVWKDIVPYKEYYQVSNFGRVKSKERINEGGRRLKSRIMKLQTTDSQVFVYFYARSKKETKKVARLVYESFREILQGDEIIKFKDNNPLNLRLENLYKISRGEYNKTTTGKPKGNKKNKGIRYKSGKYEVVCCLNNHHKYLGRFKDIEEARKVYNNYCKNIGEIK